MTTHYRITACIVTYRSPIEQVKAAVASFLRTAFPVHISLVDNDSGADYVRELEQIEGVTLIHAGGNHGFGAGHNLGFAKAPASDYHLVLNPDVVIHEGALDMMVRYLDAHTYVGLLAPRVEYPDGTLQPLNKRLPTVFDLFARRFLPKRVHERNPWVARRMARYEMRDVGYDAVVDVPFISGCCMLFRSEILRRVGGFDDRYFMYLEDCDITRRTSAIARCQYFPDASITHHWARGSHKSWRLMRVMFHSMWVYFNQWGWRLI